MPKKNKTKSFRHVQCACASVIYDSSYKEGGFAGDDSSETKCKAKQWRDDNDDVNANVKGIKDNC